MTGVRVISAGADELADAQTASALSGLHSFTLYRSLHEGAPHFHRAIFKRSFMQYKLQLSVNKSVLGTLDPEPGEYHVNAGEDLTVYAQPDSINDARFVGWSDGNTDNPRVFAPTHHTRVQAIFETDLEASVNVEIEGEGQVTGDGDYHIGDTAVLRAVLRAVPDAGYRFAGWSDGETAAERSIVVEDSVWLTATFVEE